MNTLHITIENGKAKTHTSAVDGCLTTQAKVSKAIKDMSGPDLTKFYKSLTGKEVKRFSSKDDAAKRIFRFINPKGTTAKKKTAKQKAAEKPTKKKKAPRGKVHDKVINILPHEKKIMQKGSVRSCCYEVIMDNAKNNKLTVEKYLKAAGEIRDSKGTPITEAQAIAALKKLAFPNQATQSMEVVDK